MPGRARAATWSCSRPPATPATTWPSTTRRPGRSSRATPSARRLAGGGLYPMLPPPDVNLDAGVRSVGAHRGAWTRARAAAALRPAAGPGGRSGARRGADGRARAAARAPARAARPWAGARAGPAARGDRGRQPVRRAAAAPGLGRRERGRPAGLGRATDGGVHMVDRHEAGRRAARGADGPRAGARGAARAAARQRLGAAGRRRWGPAPPSRPPPRGRWSGRRACAASAWSSCTRSTATGGEGVTRGPPRPGAGRAPPAGARARRWSRCAGSRSATCPPSTPGDARDPGVRARPGAREGRVRADRPRPAARGLHPGRAAGGLRGGARAPPGHAQLPPRRARLGGRASRWAARARTGRAGPPASTGRRAGTSRRWRPSGASRAPSPRPARRTS